MVMRITNINLQADESLLSSLIDARFKSSEVVYFSDDQALELSLLIRSNDRWEPRVLRIDGVTTCTINITDKVEFYEIGGFEFSPKDNKFVIQGHYGISVEIGLNSEFTITY